MNVPEKLKAFRCNSEALAPAKERDARLLFASLLECMLEYAPNPSGRNIVGRAINGCADDDQVHELGQYYRDNLILPSESMTVSSQYLSSNAHCGVVKARTPAPNDHPSRPSVDLDRENLAVELEEGKRDQTRLKKLVSLRLDSDADAKFARSHPDVLPEDTPVTTTVAVHILPFSLSKFMPIKKSARMSLQ